MLLTLDPKRETFCQEYIVDLNATQAAIRSGYSKASAKTTGSRLLANADVRARIAQLQKERAERTEVTADRVVKELAKIAFANTTKAIKVRRGQVVITDTKDLDEETTAAISEIKQTVTDAGGTIAIKFHDKKGALELLGKHLGIFTVEDEVADAPMPAKVVINVVDARKSA